MADAVTYVKSFVVLLLLWRLLTIGIFGQLVGGILSATLAYCLSRQSSSVPQQIKDISAPLHDLKRNPQIKLAVSLIADILSTQFIAMPTLIKIFIGQAGFIPVVTFMVQYLYDRPALTAIDILKAKIPFANYIPSCTIGWLVEQNIIKQEWLGGARGPFLKV